MKAKNIKLHDVEAVADEVGSTYTEATVVDGRLQIDISGVIAEYIGFDGEPLPGTYGSTALKRDLANADNNTPIDVYVNSPGGSLFEGINIMNKLGRRDTTVYVDGISASAASILTMSANEIIAGPGTSVLIHKTRIGVYGTADDFANVIEFMEKADNQIAKIYSERTELPVNRILEVMAKDQPMDADEALAMKLVDKIEPLRGRGNTEPAAELDEDPP